MTSDNNEQSRVLQFVIPEFLIRILGVTVVHAYMIQRWTSVALMHLQMRPDPLKK